MEKNKLNVFRLLRIVRDKSVKELADELEVTPAYINNIENGERWPAKRLLRDYAKALDVKEEVLLYFKPVDGKNDKFDLLLLKILELISEI